MTSWQQLDQNLIWHPFSDYANENANLIVSKGQGAWIFDQNGKAYLDLVSSWWVNLHGHAHPKIAAAIYEQAQKLEHIMFAGFSHQPAIELCQGLSQILPSSLSKFFFSDNGSTAVEVAIKMAYQYWHILGQEQKTLFLSFSGGYHGDTFGAMALGKSSGFHAPFDPFLFQVLNCPFPATWQGDPVVEAKEEAALQKLQQLLDIHQGKIAAIILEPLVQGSAGMLMCRPSFIEAVIQAVRKHEILVIFDEVMTGFGRSGKNFAMDHVPSQPDLLCLSKGLSGGFLPLALTVVNQSLFDAFANYAGPYTFAHGHSYTANPIACAAALASLELLLAQETQNQIKQLELWLQQGLGMLASEISKQTENFRNLGTIAAFAAKGNINHYFRQEALKQGLILRPLNQQIYLLPPYCIEHDALNHAFETLIQLIKNRFCRKNFSDGMIS